MHTTEKVLTRLVEILREDLPGLRAEPGDARGQYFLLYYARLLELLDGALRLAGQTRDAAPVSVLLRSALECSVDLKNLAEQPAYVHVVRAMMLENRSAVFHFRTQPAYGELVELCGKKAVSYTHLDVYKRQALGSGEGGGQRTGRKGAVHRARRARLGLHLRDLDLLAEQVDPAVRGPLVRGFRHGGGGSDGVNGCDVTEGVCHVTGSRIPINGHFLAHDVRSLLKS